MLTPAQLSEHAALEAREGGPSTARVFSAEPDARTAWSREMERAQMELWLRQRTVPGAGGLDADVTVPASVQIARPTARAPDDASARMPVEPSAMQSSELGGRRESGRAGAEENDEACASLESPQDEAAAQQQAAAADHPQQVARASRIGFAWSAMPAGRIADPIHMLMAPAPATGTAPVAPGSMSMPMPAHAPASAQVALPAAALPQALPQSAMERAIQRAIAAPPAARALAAPPGAERPAEPLQPVRIQYHLAPDGVAVWLGVDAHVALDPKALAAQLRQALERQGLKLQRLTCNGRPVFDAQARTADPESLPGDFP